MCRPINQSPFEEPKQTHTMSSCECSICLSEITEKTGKVSMACQHSYHFRCIANWFIEQSDNEQSETCPYCRREVSEDEALPKIDEEEGESVYDEDEETEDEGDSVSDSGSESESETESETESEEAEPRPALNTELIGMAEQLHTDLYSLEVYKHDLQNKVTEDTATLTDKSILNRIIAYEVDIKEKLKALLEMEDIQVWRISASSTAINEPSSDEQKIAEWRTKVDALWPKKRIIFNPEDEENNDFSPMNSDEEPTMKAELNYFPYDVI